MRRERKLTKIIQSALLAGLLMGVTAHAVDYIPGPHDALVELDNRPIGQSLTIHNHLDSVVLCRIVTA
ncbi:MAG: hypothetical protein ABFQ64_11530, partial [Campylobacterota bacterium]